MEQDNCSGEIPQEPDLYEQEEKCLKAIRVVRKALVMRLVMVALMVWVVVLQRKQPIVWAVAAFVLLVIGLGAMPLWQEWRKQKRRLKDLIAQEEE